MRATVCGVCVLVLQVQGVIIMMMIMKTVLAHIPLHVPQARHVLHPLLLTPPTLPDLPPILHHLHHLLVLHREALLMLLLVFATITGDEYSTGSFTGATFMLTDKPSTHQTWHN